MSSGNSRQPLKVLALKKSFQFYNQMNKRSWMKKGCLYNDLDFSLSFKMEMEVEAEVKNRGSTVLKNRQIMQKTKDLEIPMSFAKQ